MHSLDLVLSFSICVEPPLITRQTMKILFSYNPHPISYLSISLISLPLLSLSFSHSLTPCHIY